jgi:DNA-binding FadR family transcriptional regulator
MEPSSGKIRQSSYNHAASRAARASRTVVREAVAALRAEGLVVTRQH